MDNEHVFNRLASTPKSAALLAFAFSLTVAQEQAAPGDCLDKRVNCAQITGALTVLKKLGGPASTFCGSYLRIPTTTTKATTTTPTTTVTSYTSTTTIVRTACPAVAKRDARPVPFGNTEHAAVIEARANLPALSAFAAVQISLACSCLSVLPKVTITSTATASTSDYHFGNKHVVYSRTARRRTTARRSCLQ
ncbi:hypothetical protein EJ08DRAFT_186847 [Tothia fuscella]|uniref:Antifreeze protein n=1 Tax=Tothia fuscella TaxID=1048955 RepID=A0A9P4NUF6_9PEZI|nr:hypothetical protein EJ08DRAFT_186847 [Tothia fuscella]